MHESGEGLGVALAALGEVRVAADFAFEVVFGLAVTGEPDRSGSDVQVHEEVDHARLQVVLDLVDDDLLADVDELHVREVFLVFVDRLVHFFVVEDAVAKVLHRGFRILAFVVG